MVVGLAVLLAAPALLALVVFGAAVRTHPLFPLAIAALIAAQVLFVFVLIVRPMLGAGSARPSFAHREFRPARIAVAGWLVALLAGRATARLGSAFDPARDRAGDAMDMLFTSPALTAVTMVCAALVLCNGALLLVRGPRTLRPYALAYAALGWLFLLVLAALTASSPAALALVPLGLAAVPTGLFALGWILMDRARARLRSR